MRSTKLESLSAAAGEITNDKECSSRFYTDLHDLLEASRWLIATLDGENSKLLEVDQLESVLIDIEVRYVEHVEYHLISLKNIISRVLSELADRNPDAE